MTKLQNALIVLGTTLAIPIGMALLELDAEALDNPGIWVRSLILGCMNAIGTRMLAGHTPGGLSIEGRF